MTKLIKPQTLKGFRDFLPEAAMKRQYVIDIIRKTFELYGFEPIETPALEYAETLLGKYGEEADKFLYLFKDRGDRNVGLRYDQTVPLARVVAQYPDIPKPFKRYQIQPVWRAENPQRGRFREFLQCDADIVGDNFAPIANAEILSLFWAIFKKLGFKSFKIIVNSRTLLYYVIKESFGQDTKQLITDHIFLAITRVIDKLSKIGEEGVLKELSSKLVSKGFPKINIERLIDSINSMKVKTYKDLEPIDKNLYYSLQMTIENFNVPEEAIKFDPTLARGLDYYTGIIFEGIDASYQSSLGGGGRYDKLIGQFTGSSVNAIGFAIGFDRTLEASTKLNLLPTAATVTKILITIVENWENTFPLALNLATKLRNSSINTELYLNPQEKLDKQLKYADKKGIPYVAIIGPNEVKNNTVTLKNLTTGTQQNIPQKDLPNVLKQA